MLFLLSAPIAAATTIVPAEFVFEVNGPDGTALPVSVPFVLDESGNAVIENFTMGDEATGWQVTLHAFIYAEWS